MKMTSIAKVLALFPGLSEERAMYPLFVHKFN